MTTAGLPDGLAPRLAAARSLLVLTGAGMSAESGVPVFRGAGGLWEGFRPEDLATPEAFARDPVRVWRWYRWRLEHVARAAPHEGHAALVSVETQGGLASFRIVTQNVDGLHQRAGSRRVVELHGNLTRARCTACGETIPAVRVDPGDSLCSCGRGRWRPDVVWFGEPLPEAALAEGHRAALEADMVWVAGTSAVVYPAGFLPEVAARRGAVVVEVNPEATPFSALAAYRLAAPASRGLRALADALLARA
jgi:NAD-dependent deacetylase